MVCRKEFEQVKNVPHLRVYIYSSTETKQEDIDRATAMLDSVGIKNIIYRKDIPIKHFSDEELMQWAKKKKQTELNMPTYTTRWHHKGCPHLT